MAEIAEMTSREPRPVAVPVSMDPTPSESRARPSATHVERAEAGEQWIARLLRGGALCSGALFLVSLALESLPDSESVHVLIDILRKGAASALLVTPVVRLMVAGTTLGLRGEWRYALYAAGVLGLLAVAVGTGLHA
ncbi:hypothetical protein MEBOL_005847 [Melittangium boletus DSM 14713]|uniref:DUF1634 domain-containing protein n=2 Tax=Melittangium boletus TaxID=83453 RepID=A0A250IMA4_9BACT|nr:hypothetical protein MEBOL_005847 [Melittangium boletus DSM 14713]